MRCRGHARLLSPGHGQRKFLAAAVGLRFHHRSVTGFRFDPQLRSSRSMLPREHLHVRLQLQRHSVRIRRIRPHSHDLRCWQLPRIGAKRPTDCDWLRRSAGRIRWSGNHRKLVGLTDVSSRTCLDSARRRRTRGNSPQTPRSTTELNNRNLGRDRASRRSRLARRSSRRNIAFPRVVHRPAIAVGRSPSVYCAMWPNPV